MSRYWAMDILFSSLSICLRFVTLDNLDFSYCFSSSSSLSDSDSDCMSISLSSRENCCFCCMGSRTLHRDKLDVTKGGGMYKAKTQITLETKSNG